MQKTNTTHQRILAIVDEILYTIERDRPRFTPSPSKEKIIIGGVETVANQIRLHHTAHGVTPPDLSEIVRYLSEGLATAHPEGWADGTPELLTVFKIMGLATHARGEF